MAAVQATPAMQQQQQGGNASMVAQANNILPPGMTKEQVQAMYKVSLYLALPMAWVGNTMLMVYIAEIPDDEAAGGA
jgi:hypothetical protein